MKEESCKDVRMSNIYYNKIKIADFASVFFSTYGISLCVLLYYMKSIDNIKNTRDTILAYSCVCTIGLILTIYIRYDLNLTADKILDLMTEYDTLWSTGQWKSLFGEILIVIIAPYPFLYDIKYDEYNE